MCICLLCRCSNTNLEGVVSEILSALLKQLTDLERHEEDLRACQSTTEKVSKKFVAYTYYISTFCMRKLRLRILNIFNTWFHIGANFL